MRHKIEMIDDIDFSYFNFICSEIYTESYENNRKPVKIQITDSLFKQLKKHVCPLQAEILSTSMFMGIPLEVVPVILASEFSEFKLIYSED